MIELGAFVLSRIDILVGLYALTLVFACFALMTIHSLIGVAALVTIVFVMVGWVEGYTKGLIGSAEDSASTERLA